MTPHYRPVLGILVALASAFPAAAQESRDSARADSARRLREVIVETRRTISTVGGSPAVDAQLEALRLPASPTLEQVFRTLPLLHVRRNSRGEAEISARGSDSRQVAVLVDGVPLTLAWDGRVDASVIPANAIQRIGFVRGLSSMLYGPNVLGGVVELGVGQSFSQPASPTAQLSTGLDHVGSFGATTAATIPLENPSGRWLIRGGMGFSDSPGQPLARGVSEPVSTGEDLRLNTDSRIADGFGSLRYQSNRGAWFSLSGTTFHSERGIAAELGVQNARFWRYPRVSRTLAVASGGTGDRRTPFGGRGDLEASLGIDLGTSEVESYASRSYTEVNGFENGADRTLTLRLLGDHTLGERADLRGSFTASDIRHEESVPEGDATYQQRLWSLGGETVWRPIEGAGAISSLRLSLGGAFDLGQTPQSGGREPLGTIASWGARAGFAALVGEGNTLIHGGVSRRARFPSLRELYSGALNRFAPNPGLKPETLVAVESGMTSRLGETELQAVVFRHQLDDAVVRVVLPDSRFQRVNRDRLTSYGLELLASTMVGRATVGADLTAQSVRLTDPGLGTTARPENLPELFGTAFLRAPVGLGLMVGAEARHTGNQYCVDPGTGADTRLEGGTVLNGEVTRSWRIRSDALFGRLETAIAVFNAGNIALYDQCGLPEPGRLVRLQVRVH